VSVVENLETSIKSKHVCLMQWEASRALTIEELAENEQNIKKLQEEINEIHRAIGILKGAGL
jgi:cupin superfamily acireductone dioxygenase involved in methionine salvage